jgi:hypothetical protein
VNEHQFEEYKGSQIETNRTPLRTSNYTGFGWAFQVFEDDKKQFRLVTKCLNKNSIWDESGLRRWGLKRVHEMIDTREFEQGHSYCYLVYPDGRFVIQ